ncbi:carbohydrate-binding protein (plasmid) [Persicobacter psychrovividus]|uniref:Carbohydrate-binding protein n=2 Tax=Persicobacter psychrovividus TaxID=387638 RepID=A0ABM7VJN6_9BACT|nr:carbohydrate-binding protein [Persicobacter psychrovividus]
MMAAGAMSACSDLDLKPHDQLSDESFWRSSSDFEMATNAVYQDLDGRIKMFWVNSQDIFTDALTDLCGGGIYGSDEIAAGTLQPDNAYLNNIWNPTYRGIRRANNFFEKLDRAIAEGGVDANDPKIKELSGQVRIIRASLFFRLANYWGNAPMPLKTLSRDEANSIAVTSKEDLLKEAISELKLAGEELDNFNGENNRLTKYSAFAYLVRIYMSQENWTEASKYAKLIIDSGQYELYSTGHPETDYRDLFTPKGNNCKEAIVAHNFTNTTWSYSHGTFEVASMWGLQRPSDRFLDMVLSDQGKVIEYVDEKTGEPITHLLPEDELLASAVGKEIRKVPSVLKRDQYHLMEDHKDPRWKQTILPYNGLKANTWNKTEIDNDAVAAPVFLKGFDDDAIAGYSYNSQKHVIRLAEIFLSYAEAQNELGNSAVAIEYVNKVRDRVGMINVTGTFSKAQTREIVRRERCVELINEGQLFFDYKRWKTADGKSYLEEATNRNGGIHPVGYESVVLGQDAEGEPIKGVDFSKRPNDRLVRSYTSPRNDYWPFPMNEVQINPNMPQKAGW